jgi:hypothetical protein
MGDVPPGFRRSVRQYTGRGYRELNRKLRVGEVLSPTEQKVHEQLWKLLAGTPATDEPRVVRRIVRLPEKYRETLGGLFQGHTTEDPRVQRVLQKSLGKTVTLPGYTSTSRGDVYGPDFGAYDFPGQLLLSIKARHGLSVRSHSYHPGEHELLLPHNSKFNVLNYNKMSGGAHHMTLEQIV